jgi:hypothetical protein
MADRATWAKRVADWRASGLTSSEFCADKPFTPGGLRNAAHELRRFARPEAPVRIARVVRLAAPLVATTSAPSTPEVPVVVELGGARVVVARGVDRDALATVLDVLAARGGAA